MDNKAELISRQLLDANLNKKNWGAVMYNVLANGLRGDGVTDDTAALQTLINKAAAEGRNTILFPHGTYYVTSLTDADKVDFVGDNSVFVGGYVGEIGNIGGFASHVVDYTLHKRQVGGVLPTTGEYIRFAEISFETIDDSNIYGLFAFNNKVTTVLGDANSNTLFTVSKSGSGTPQLRILSQTRQINYGVLIDFRLVFKETPSSETKIGLEATFYVGSQDNNTYEMTLLDGSPDWDMLATPIEVSSTVPAGYSSSIAAQLIDNTGQQTINGSLIVNSVTAGTTTADLVDFRDLLLNRDVSVGRDVGIAGKLFIGAVSYSMGIGSPEGVITAEVGSIYTRRSGGTSTTLYVKTSGTGNTGWTAK